jgi:erythronate-4-phosphate dehydrogenase
MKIVADDKIPYLKGVLESRAEVVYLPGVKISRSELDDADVLIVRTRTKCNKSLLEGTKVKLVVTATIGTDHFDIPWLNETGIEWSNAPGCNSGSVRQYIGSVMAHLIDNGMDPAQTTIGIVGAGMVGSKIEQLSRSLGMHVLLNDPPRARKEGSEKFVDLDTLLQQSDIVTFHTPLNMEGTDKSYHLFNEESLEILKKGAVVINSSRGEVTCSRALLKGIETGHISRLILDVWENEPDISLELLQKTWIATPHIAGYSVDGKGNGTMMSVNTISKKYGLGLDQWKPDNLTPPEFPIIDIDAEGKSAMAVAALAILHTYDIFKDDERLKANPGNFENLRGGYAPRREFDSYTVKLLNGDYKAAEVLKLLGFIVVTD